MAKKAKAKGARDSRGRFIKAAPKKPAKKARKPAKKPVVKRKQGQNVQLRELRKIKNAILASLRKGGMRGAAVEAAGISRTTFARWCREDREFAKACMQAQAQPILRVHGANYVNALKPEGFQDRKLFIQRNSHYDDEAPSNYLMDPAPELAEEGPAPAGPSLEDMNDEQLEKYIARLEAGARAE